MELLNGISWSNKTYREFPPCRTVINNTLLSQCAWINRRIQIQSFAIQNILQPGTHLPRTASPMNLMKVRRFIGFTHPPTAYLPTHLTRQSTNLRTECSVAISFNNDKWTETLKIDRVEIFTWPTWGKLHTIYEASFKTRDKIADAGNLSVLPTPPNQVGSALKKHAPCSSLFHHPGGGVFFL